MKLEELDRNHDPLLRLVYFNATVQQGSMVNTYSWWFKWLGVRHAVQK
ncbi:MAG: hypothetical protein QW542_01055 [Thermoproteota archaeon]